MPDSKTPSRRHKAALELNFGNEEEEQAYQPMCFSSFVARCPCLVLLFMLAGSCALGVLTVFPVAYPVQVDTGISSFKVESAEVTQHQDAFLAALQNSLSSAPAVKVEDEEDHDGRRLQGSEAETEVSVERRKSGFFLNVVYYLPGGNLLQPAMLKKCRRIEQSLMAQPAYKVLCRLDSAGECLPPVTALNFFYPSVVNGSLQFNGRGKSLYNTTQVLTFLLRNSKYGFFDQNFTASNPKSSVLSSTFRFGLPLKGFASKSDRNSEQRAIFKDTVAELLPFLRGLQEEDFRVIYGGIGINEVEFVDEVFGDAALAAGSLLFIFAYMWFHTSSLFLAICGLIQIVLSFPAVYYVYRVAMGVAYMGVLNFMSLFVIAGIATDDMFVFVDIFKQAWDLDDNGVLVPLQSRLAYTYRRAGKAMLVTTATTAGSFFANSISSIPPIRLFGTWVGMLVVYNYLLVMTFIPAAVVLWDKYLRSGCLPCVKPSCCRKEGVSSTQSKLDGAAAAAAGGGEPEAPARRVTGGPRLFGHLYNYVIYPGRWLLLLLFVAGLALAAMTATGLQPASKPPLVLPDDHNIELLRSLRAEVLRNCDNCLYTDRDGSRQIGVGDGELDVNRPGVPPAVVATAVSTAAIDILWQPPSYSGTAALNDVAVLYARSGSNTWLRANVEGDLETRELRVTGLRAGTVYNVRSAGGNSFGYGPPSPTVQVETLSLVPLAPAAPSVQLETTGVRLSFTPPAYTGPANDAITGMVAYMSPAVSQLDWWLLGSSPSVSTAVTSNELCGGETAVFAAAAVNQYGVGRRSEPGAAVFLPKFQLAPPLPVEGPSTTPTAVEISWSAPACTAADGSETVASGLEYRLDVVVDGGSPQRFITEDTSVIIDGLAPETPVSAVLAMRYATTPSGRRLQGDDEGWGDSSPPASLQTLPPTPGAPPAPAASVITSDSMQLTWQQPEQPGTSAVSSYQLQMRLAGGASAWTTAYDGPLLTAAIGSLTRDTRFDARVLARNDAGAGDYSDVSTVRTLPDVPGQPDRPTVGASSRETLTMEVSWLVPDTGGSFDPAALTFQLQLTQLGDQQAAPAVDAVWTTVFNSTGTSAFVTVPAADAVYALRVACWNRLGRGDFSDATIVSRFSAAPPPPTNLVAAQQAPPAEQPRTCSVLLTWDAPVSGAPPTEYDLLVSTQPGGATALSARQAAADGRSRTVLGLQPGSSYTFVVAAASDVGTSDASSPLAFSCAALVPLPPSQAPQLQSSLFDSLVISWSPSEDDGGATVSSYSVFIRQTATGGSAPAAWTEAVMAATTSATLTDLAQDSSYDVAVAASNSAGTGSRSPAAVMSTVVTLPGAPTLLRTTQEPEWDSVSLAWTPSTQRGSSTLSEFELQIGLAPAVPPAASDDPPVEPTQVISAGLLSSATLPNLQPVTAYAVRVRQVNNDVGAGAWGAALHFTTAQGRPSAPTAPMLSGAALASLQADWTAPAEENAGPLSAYELQWQQQPSGDSGSLQVDAVESTVAIAPLLPSTPYAFRVRARNDEAPAWSDWSPFSASMSTRSVLPDQPAAPAASSPTFDAVQLTWQAPAYTGNSQVIAYEMRATPTAGQPGLTVVSNQTAGGVLAAALTGLQPLASYTAALRARSEGGWGNFSVESAPFVMLDDAADKPAAPSFSDVAALSVTVDWVAPDYVGDGPLVGWELEATNGSSSTTLALGLATSTSLDTVGSTAYDCRVRVQNSAGKFSEWSDVASVTTLASEPDAPAAPTTTSVGVTSFTMNWLAPTYSGETAIEAYEVAINSAGAGFSAALNVGAVLTHSFSALAAGTVHVVRVRALNGAYASSWSATAEVTTLTEEPGAPTDLTLDSITHDSATLSWTAPSHTGVGSTLTYELRATGGSGDVTTTGSATTLVLTGLDSVTAYSFTVRARNDVDPDYGVASTSVDDTTLTEEPSAPTDLMLDAITVSTATLSWTAPSHTGVGSTLTYELRATGGSGDVTTTGSATTLVLTGLDSVTAYSFTVRARNDVDPDYGVASNSVDGTTSTAEPGAPTELTVQSIDSSSASLTWTAPVSTGAGSTLTYELQATDGSSAPVVGTTSSTALVLSSLSPQTTYTFTVRARNDVDPDYGPASDAAVEATLTEEPGAPTDLTLDSITHDSATLSWTAPSHTGVGSTLTYELRATGGSGDVTTTGSATTLVLTGLDSVTAYSFTVRARNDVDPDYGVASTSVDNTTLSASPDSVTAPQVADVLAESANVSWTAPVYTGASSLDLYELEFAVTSGSGLATSLQLPVSQTHHVASLNHSTGYTVRVRSRNTLGLWSAWSATSANFTTLSGLPDAVAAPTISAVLAHSFVVDWQSPAYTGIGPLSSWQLDLQADGMPSAVPIELAAAMVGEPPSTTVTVQPLTSYRVRVRSRNGGASGWSDWSMLSAEVSTPSAVPLAAAAPSLSEVQALSLRATWTAPAAGAAAIDHYEVDWSSPAGGDRLNSTALTEVLSPLQASQAYAVRVRAFNAFGAGPWSASSEATTTGSAPGPPAALTVQALGDTTVTVDWQPPVYTGAGPVAGYDVILRLADGSDGGGALQRQQAASDRSLTATGLTQASAYEVEVVSRSATDAGGSAIVSFTTLRQTPTAPLQLAVVSTTNSSATVSWQPPTYSGPPGDDAVLSYSVQLLSDGGDWLSVRLLAASSRSAVVTGLQAASTYSVRVLASNGGGAGDPSDTVLATTDAGRPAAQAPGLQVTAGSDDGDPPCSLTASWTAGTVDNDGGLPVTAFWLALTRDNVTWATVAAGDDTTSSAVLAPLAGGQRISVQLLAENSAGVASQLPCSTGACATLTCPSSRPSAPSAVVAGAIGQTTVQLTWFAPADSGEAGAVLAYKLQSRPDGSSDEGDWLDRWTGSAAPTGGQQMDATYLLPQAEMTATVGDLPGGRTLELRMLASNSAGFGAASSTTVVTLAAVLPEAAVLTVVDSGAGGGGDICFVQLAWTMPYNGGDAIDGYYLQTLPSQAITRLTPSSGILLSPLAAGSSDSWRVRGENSVGNGSWSAAVSHSCAATVPAAVPGVQVSSNAAVAALVSWDEPSSGGAALLNFTIMRAPASDASNWTDLATVTSLARDYDDATAVRGKSYLYAVRAGNSIGVGPASAATAVTIVAGPPSAMDAPLLANVTAVSADVYWLPPAEDGGSPVVRFELQNSLSGGALWQTVQNSSQLSWAVAGLSGGVQMLLRVRSSNGAQLSPWSAAALLETPQCVGGDDCNGAGLCSLLGGQPACVCSDGFVGEDCSLACPGDGAVCGGRGVCSLVGGEAVCACDNGYGGAACDEFCPTGGLGDAFCSNNGVCNSTDLTCTCDVGFTGEACQLSCPSACSGHGKCEASIASGGLAIAACVCDREYAGDACDRRCPDGCNGHGRCNEDALSADLRCECDGGYLGAHCSITCPALVDDGDNQGGKLACHGNGQCSLEADDTEPVCTCIDGWVGQDCGVECPSTLDETCSGHGVCALESVNASRAVCSCDDSFKGSSCADIRADRFPLPSFQYADMTVMFGVSGVDLSKVDPNDPDDLGRPIYDTAFDLRDPDAQRFLLHFCERLENRTGLLYPRGSHNKCWPRQFAVWVARNRDYEYPVPPANLTADIIEYADDSNLGDWLGVTSDRSRVLWLRLKFKSTVNSELPGNALEKFYFEWREAMKEELADAPETLGDGFFTSDLWVRMQVELEFVRGSILACVISVSCSFISIVLFTGNLLLSIYCVLVIIAILVSVLAIFVLMGWTLGVVEAVSLVVLVGLSIDYALHMAHAYNESSAEETMPRKGVKLRERHVRTKNGLVTMGVSIASAGVTTLGATLLLLLATIRILATFGLVIAITTGLSLLFTFFLFTTILSVAGPHGDVCNLFFCFRARGAKKEGRQMRARTRSLGPGMVDSASSRRLDRSQSTSFRKPAVSTAASGSASSSTRRRSQLALLSHAAVPARRRSSVGPPTVPDADAVSESGVEMTDVAALGESYAAAGAAGVRE